IRFQSSLVLLVLLSWLSTFLVSGEFFRTNVALINAGLVDHHMQPLHHPRRSRNIVNRRRGVLQVLGKHLFVDHSGLTVPWPLRLLHPGHARDEPIIRILLLPEPVIPRGMPHPPASGSSKKEKSGEGY